MTRKRALVITILILLAASVVTASIMLSGKRDNTPSPGTSLGTNAEGFEISPVAAGEGGTALGPDGVTPIAYPPTCEGAYAAAINYHKADQTLNKNWEKTRMTLMYITANQQAVEDSIEVSDELVKQHGLQDYAVPDVRSLGIFKPLNCESGKSARVIVSDVTLAKFPDSEPYIVVKAGPTEVIWKSGDWKLVPVNDPRDEESLNLQLQTETIPPITSEIIDALFTADDGRAISREGWMVVKNASR